MGKHQFAIGNDDFEVEVGVRHGNQVDVVVNGTSYEVELKSEVASAAIRAAAPSPSAPVAMAAAIPAAAPKAPVAAGAAGDVTAPLAGLILKINVKQGDVVKAGDAVVVIEAMKMENAIAARADGTIQSVSVREQDSVAMGDVLVTIG